MSLNNFSVKLKFSYILEVGQIYLEGRHIFNRIQKTSIVRSKMFQFCSDYKNLPAN